jgi:hypothetical protein
MISSLKVDVRVILNNDVFGSHLGGRLFSSQAYSWQVVAVSLTSQCVRIDFCLTQVLVNFQLIVLDQLKPPLLPHVQIRLG